MSSHTPVGEPAALELQLDVLVGERRAEIDVLERLRPLARELVVNAQGGADGGAGIGGNGEREDVVEQAALTKPAVHLHVQGDAARETEPLAARRHLEVPHQAQHAILQDALRFESQSFVDRLQGCPALARRQPEQAHQMIGKAIGVGVRPVMNELGTHVIAPTVVRDRYHPLQRFTELAVRLTVGREPHHLVFAVVSLETQIFGDGRVEPAERIRDLDLVDQLHAVAGAEPDGGALGVPGAIDGHDQRVVVRRHVICRRGVRGVVREEAERRHLVGAEEWHDLAAQPLTEVAFLKAGKQATLPGQGRRVGGMLGIDALIERAHTAVRVTRNVPAVGDAIDIFQFKSGLLKAEIDRSDGKDVRRVLVSQQPFLFHIALDYAIPQQARSWIDPPEVTNNHHQILSFSAPYTRPRCA